MWKKIKTDLTQLISRSLRIFSQAISEKPHFSAGIWAERVLERFNLVGTITYHNKFLMKSIEKSTTNIDNRPTKSMNLHHPTGPALFLHTQYLAITKGAMATYGNPIMMGSLQPPLSFLFSEVPPLFQKEKKRSHVEPGKQESLAHLVDFSCSAHPKVNGHDHSEGCKKKKARNWQNRWVQVQSSCFFWRGGGGRELTKLFHGWFYFPCQSWKKWTNFKEHGTEKTCLAGSLWKEP